MSNTNMGYSHLLSSLPLQHQNSHISTSLVLVLTQQREDGGGRIYKAAEGRDRTVALHNTSAQDEKKEFLLVNVGALW